MSRIEFDAYLASLLKSLHVRAGRSADLADELRDHFEARLADLLVEGKSREEAARMALAEFGKADELAHKFTHLAKSRRRRFVMRCTAASSIVVAGVLLAVVALMPSVPQGPGPAPVVGQTEAPEPEGESVLAIASSGPGEISVEQKAIAALDRKLSQEVTADFENVPLTEAINEIAEQIQADVIIDEAAIEEGGLSLDAKVSLQLEHTAVTARAVYGFLLEPSNVALANRSGVIFITTEEMAEELLTMKVYNVRDIIERAAPSYTMNPGAEMGMGGMGGMGMYSVTDQIVTGVVAGSAVQMGGMGMGMGGMGMSLGYGSPELNASLALRQLIIRSSGGPWQMIDGQGGSIQIFDGLLVVRQSEEVHNTIQKLLDGLRATNRNGPGSSVTLPKGEAVVDEEAVSGGKGLRDLSVLGEYELTADARAALLAIETNEDGLVSQLEAFRAVTLTMLPSNEGKLAWRVITPLGVSQQQLANAIRKGQSQDKPLGDLKSLLNAAKKYANGQPIDAEHLFLAVTDHKDGPIPAVLAHLGLTAERLRERILGEEPGDGQATEFQRNTEDSEQSPKTSSIPFNIDRFNKVQQSGVTIKVSTSETGHDYGSGMIISSTKGETLILTAWHLFRGLDDDAKITVTLSDLGEQDGKADKYSAELIASDEKADLALLRIKDEIDRPVVKIGTMADLPAIGQRLACIVDGDTLLLQKVVAINQFTGPSSISCSGAAVKNGSSGGGLVTGEKRLVGICFARTAGDGESRNIYAGLAAIRQFLEQAGYGELVPETKSAESESESDAWKRVESS